MPRETRVRHRLSLTSAAMVALTMLVGASVTTTAAADDTAPAPSAPSTPSGPLAGEMTRMLEVRPGGVQVSDNAMAWPGGGVMVWPAPGETHAPAGLGSNVRDDVVEALGLARAPGAGAAPAAPMARAAGWDSCDPGYYCFFSGASYSGSRLQFASTCSGNASSWGFSNITSSWVNRNYTKVVYAYDYSGGAHLWTMNPGAMDSRVSSGDDNRMSYWACSYV